MKSQNVTLHRFNMMLPHEEFRQAAEAARQQDLSLAQLVRKLLRDHVEMRKTNELVIKNREYRRA